MRKSAKYTQAIRWIVANDDTEWLKDGPDAAPSVSACLVADLFGWPDHVVREDLLKEEERASR